MNANYIPQANTSKTNNALVAHSEAPSQDWYLETGASSHMTNVSDNICQPTPYTGNDGIFIGDGRNIPIAHSGTGILPTPNRKFLLSNLLHVPQISYNLLSISQLVKDNNISITFDPSGFVCKDLTTNKQLLRGPCRAGLYKITPTSAITSPEIACTASKNPNFTWHDRLGHPNFKILKNIAQSNSAIHIPSFNSSCTTCIQCKLHKLPFEISTSRMNTPLALVHSDVWGPSPSLSTNGFRFFVIFVDDFSRYTWLFPLTHKSEVTSTFITFTKFIENQTKQSIKILRTDGGTEFNNYAMKSFLHSKGIGHQMSCPYTPEQNGVAERKNRHIMETARSLLHRASMPFQYWPEATSTAVYLINRMPSPNTQDKSPLHLLFNTTPDYTHLRVFGCACFPLLPSHSRTKFDPKSKSHVFMGYSDRHKGYICFDRESHKPFISRHVRFIENSFPFATDHSSSQISSPDLPYSLLLPTSKSPEFHMTHTNTQPQASPSTIPTRTPAASPIHPPMPDRNNIDAYNPSIPAQVRHPMITRAQTGSLRPPQRLNLMANSLNPADSDPDPTTFKDASKHKEWRQAMADEFVALQQQGTWDLVPPPSNAPVLGCKWTFRKKFNSDGNVARFKARLVAQGNQQEYGIDYGETFSPVAKLPTIRVLFTIALSNGWPVQQLDVSNAFLHGDLTDTVYMAQPRGFIDNEFPDHVCHLRKSIYGLRQAPRQWYTTFTKHLIQLGFQYSTADPSLLTFKRDSTLIFLLVYVDDILVTGNNEVLLSDILSKLHSKFNMKNLGLAHHFLGIKIQKIQDKFFLSQSAYAASILHSVNLSHCNPLANPSCTKLPDQCPRDSKLSTPETYKRITGSLQYLTLTRPDIAHAVNVLSQHLHDPSPKHCHLDYPFHRAHYNSLPTQTPTGRAIPSLESPQRVTAHFSAARSSRGQSRSRQRLRGRPQNPNIGHSPQLLPTPSGSSVCSPTLASLTVSRSNSSATTHLPLHSRIIRCITPARSTSKSITGSSGITFKTGSSASLRSALFIKLQTSLLSLFLQLDSKTFAPNSRFKTNPQFDRGY
ncbi:Retrovirus-related Pol polyprotein from transposon TNT 1-94 [Dendrobium catenatum]|uniref:Retrovirus-related Pol polyprotein from transposon TNT 1-94 n=1 Tax=Dendrobium catenatum TaxID=906689 RepID=A0A2I0WJ54_9ASPA|nr:Retrovirus-related Pol polyprotein from transposon TNT 1-94 [Dendrobium catenatum]